MQLETPSLLGKHPDELGVERVGARAQHHAARALDVDVLAVLLAAHSNNAAVPVGHKLNGAGVHEQLSTAILEVVGHGRKEPGAPTMSS